MKQIVIMLCWIMPIMSQAQVKFSTAKNWNAVLAQAKQEKKLIFLDAMASWCGPCKQMDAEVYTDATVADFVNKNFIPVKVQFDQTKNDAKSVKSWYEDAKKLMNQYSINAYPTLLFIDADGKVVEKGLGYQPVAKFLALGKLANDPQGSYASQLAKYHKGQFKGQELMSFALRAKKIPDLPVANMAADEYRINVLNREDPAKLLNVELRDFIVEFQKQFNLTDPFVNYVYAHPVEVDAKLEYKDFAQKVMDYLIDRDLIMPIVEPKGVHQSVTPNWKTLSNKIKKAYDKQTAERLIMQTRIDWYKAEKDWPNVVKYTIAQLENTNLDTVGFGARSKLNNISFNIIFTYSNDPVALKKAIGYMELIIPHNPEMHTWLDTYANLLYKVGRREEAIIQEAKALKVTKESKHPYFVKEYEMTLDKMKNNEPTWLTSN